jgi:hypothetical protein
MNIGEDINTDLVAGCDQQGNSSWHCRKSTEAHGIPSAMSWNSGLLAKEQPSIEQFNDGSTFEHQLSSQWKKQSRTDCK